MGKCDPSAILWCGFWVNGLSRLIQQQNFTLQVIVLVISFTHLPRLRISFFNVAIKAEVKFNMFMFAKNRIFEYYFTVLTHVFSLTDLMPQVKVQSVETVEGCTHEVSAVEKHV